MPLKTSAVLLLLSVSIALFGQSTEWKMAYSMPLKTNLVKLDQLNNIYALHKGELLKFDPSGNEMSRYSNKLMGDDVHMDITNPMKVLLYSPQQMQLFTLDSRLGQMNETINFFKAGFEQISLVATSHSNGMWLYDPINFRMIRVDEKLNEDRRTLNIAQLLRVQLYPTDLIEVNDKVLLTDPNHGVFVFDVFGNYIKKIPVKGIEHLVVSDGRLFYMENEKFVALHLADNSIEDVSILLAEHKFFWVNRSRIAELTPVGINIYQAFR